METGLIAVRQLPVIEERLLSVKQDIETRVGEVLSLAVTEETLAAVKKARAELNKEYKALEEQRLEVKRSILAPYEQFEQVYNECCGNMYKSADKQLKERIGQVEGGLKEQKTAAVQKYFDEYRVCVGLDESFVTMKDVGLNITLSASLRSLKAACESFLDRIVEERSSIETMDDADEILVEYRRNGFSLSGAVNTVAQRHEAQRMEQERRERMAAERAAREEALRHTEQVIEEETKNAEVFAPPVQEEPPKDEPKVYSTVFRVTGTMEQLRALKNYLVEGGFNYESVQ